MRRAIARRSSGSRGRGRFGGAASDVRAPAGSRKLGTVSPQRRRGRGEDEPADEGSVSWPAAGTCEADGFGSSSRDRSKDRPGVATWKGGATVAGRGSVTTASTG